MSGTTRVTLFPHGEDLNRKPTAQELATVPTMTREEMREIMRSPEYKTSSLVRSLVAASIAKSGDLSVKGEDQERVQTGDEFLAKRETVAAMMRDPRYKHDALYRLEVKQKISNLTAMDNAAISGGDISAPNTKISLGVSSSPFHGADLRVHKLSRIQLSTDHDDSKAPAKPAKPTREPFSN